MRESPRIFMEKFWRYAIRCYMALHPAWIAEIFHGLDFKNNGESDLATGTLAPIKFYELTQRELNYANRANSPLTMISIGYTFNKETLLWLEYSDISKTEIEFLISEILDLIISVAAKVSKTLRSNEVVARLGVITFAILIRDDATAAKILTARLLSILEASRDEFANNLIGSAFELMQLEVNVLCNSYKANTNLAQFLSSVNF